MNEQHTERRRLTLGMCVYDHVRDLMDGSVAPDRLALEFRTFPTAQPVFRHFLTHRDWDGAEMSMGALVSMLSRGDDSLVALPVFLSRMFRQSAVFVRRGGPIGSFAQLEGRRIGVADWTQTAGIYVRGFLAHECGVPLRSIEWVQAGVNEPVLHANATADLPPGLRFLSRPGETLDELLATGGIDAVISPQPLRSALGDDPRTERLAPANPEAEASYFARTGIFPIMHVLVLRRDVYAAAPWIAQSLGAAFTQAKEQSLRRVNDMAISRYPVPWLGAAARQAGRAFGRDIWPYGIEANRRTLDAFLAYAHEQGVAARRLQVEELFVEDLPASTPTA